MKLIAGLGNPGVRYAYSRHIIGFLVLDALARSEGIKINREKFGSYIGRGSIHADPIILAKPQTFMNLSGVAVGKLADYFRLGAEDIIIVHDDMDISTGDIRIKVDGGTAGHNGLISIVNHLRGPEFVRVRFGIGRPVAGEMADSYVLNRFSGNEMLMLPRSIERACDAVIKVVSSGVNAAMNTFNVRITKNLSEEV